MYLLTADWHLDDNPDNEYRWLVFDYVCEALGNYPILGVFILGDIVDRKDRHSAALVNRLLAELHRIDVDVTVLRGNHDTTLQPPCYFEWLHGYISMPTRMRGNALLLLPFSANPREDWQHLQLAEFRAVFMHATVSGAVVDRGYVLDNPRMPPLPPGPRYYSGDIHHPQQVGNLVYVGAPHPTKFGDDYRCRMLLVDEDSFEVVEEIILDPPRKWMIDIRSVADLEKFRQMRRGDQVKLRLSCRPGAVDELAQAEAQIAEWARRSGVTLAGTEVIVNAPLGNGVDTNLAPEAILRQFAAQEALTTELLGVGLQLLKEVTEN